MKSSGKLKKFFLKPWNYLNTIIMDDEKIHNLIFESTLALLGISAIVAIILNIATHETALSIVSTFLFLCSFISLYLYARYSFFKKISKVLFGIVAIGSLTATFFIGINNYSFVSWSLLLPTCGVLLLGLKVGTLCSLIFGAELILFMWTPLSNASFMVSCGVDIKIRFPILYFTAFVIHFCLFYIYGKTREHYLEMSSHDQLTRAYSRTGFVSAISKSLQGSDNQKVAYLIADIDKFKAINDTYGHFTGDRALIEIVKTMAEVTNSPICRWGGEEFALFLKDGDKAEYIAEEIRKTVENHKFTTDNGKAFDITVSIGVCITSDTSGFNHEKYFKIADESLYEAKNSGRNRCVYTKLTDF